MALILKNYTNEYGITSDLYLMVDSLHTMFGDDTKGTRVAINTKGYTNLETRLKENSKPILQNKTWLINDRPISNAKNMLDAGYQLLKADLQEKGYTVEDDINTYGEDMKAEQLAQQEQLSQEINDGTE